jgi:hypothetical protein
MAHAYPQFLGRLPLRDQALLCFSQRCARKGRRGAYLPVAGAGLAHIVHNR